MVKIQLIDKMQQKTKIKTVLVQIMDTVCNNPQINKDKKEKKLLKEVEKELIKNCEFILLNL